MPHFYLNIHDSNGEAEDEEGVDVRSLTEAHEHAISGIRCILGAELFDGTIDLNGRIEIVDTDQKVQLVVPFREAVTVLDMEEPRSRWVQLPTTPEISIDELAALPPRSGRFQDEWPASWPVDLVDGIALPKRLTSTSSFGTRRQMSQSDPRYYRRREAQELKAATMAPDPRTGRLHRDMAERYADLAEQAEQATLT